MRYPTVTQVLGPLTGLEYVNPTVLAAACSRGTEVHTACLNRAEGRFILVAPGLAGFFRSFCAWFDSLVDEVIAIETRLVDDVYQFSGQPDLICRMKDDPRIVICDLKTSKAAGRTWCGQLAGYRHLAEKNGYGPIGRVFSLRLKQDGSMPLADEYTYSDRDFAAFLSALTAYRYFKL